jgi:hypothetical protein
MLPVHLLIHLLGKQLSAKATRIALKRPTCSHCREPYVYQARRTAQASGYAFLHLGAARKQLNTNAKAQKLADYQIATAVDPIPCPACGHLQPDMIAALRKSRLRTLGIAAAFTAILLVPAWIMINSGMFPAAERPLRLITIATVALFLLAAVAILFHNPNAAPHRRTRDALGPKCRALPAKEFDALLHGTPLPDR